MAEPEEPPPQEEKLDEGRFLPAARQAPPVLQHLDGDATPPVKSLQAVPEAGSARGSIPSSPLGRKDAEELRRELRAKEAEVATLRMRLQEAQSPGSLAAGLDGGRMRVISRGVGSPMPGTPGGSSSSGRRPLSIIIPMGDLGGEFAEAGFKAPKPLVNVVGRPVLLWLLDHLSFAPEDSVTLAVPAVVDRQHGISKLVKHAFPHVDIRVVCLPFETRGWVETVFSVVRQMPAKELRRQLVTLDCATIYHGVDVLGCCRVMQEQVGASVYFEVDSQAVLTGMGAVASQFSYLKLEGDGMIKDIREKTVISSAANSGAYIFRSVRAFRDCAERLLEELDESSRGGLYASSLISAMITGGEKFRGLKVHHSLFNIVATPRQLETFTVSVSSGQLTMERKMRFCFDLDGTLVTEPHEPGNLATCDPISKAITLVRQLHTHGHTIIITTARGMQGGQGVDMAIAEIGAATFKTLSEFGIPYHELHFGKPYADVYVDSRSLNAQADIERDLGWHVNLLRRSVSDDVDQALDGAIDARAFNLVRKAGKARVIKSSTPDVLRGECHWYRSIPPGLAGFFPKPIEIVEGDTYLDTAALSSITMCKVQGTTFSHLATARVLMKVWLRKLVHTLHKMHTQEPPAESPLASEPHVTTKELCSNYAGKVASRVRKYQDLYDSLGDQLGINTRRMSERIIKFLEEFELNERTQRAWYIHGDPVFSNIIRTDDDEIVLIDMRGELGSKLTTQGDVHYDLSKVFQSLCGYDFMLLDQELDETSSEIFDGLRATFWEEVRRLYPSINLRDVRLHTACHFFAIVPLHEVRSRMARYLQTSHSMLLVEGLL